jgi:hypothetical protein
MVGHFNDVMHHVVFYIFGGGIMREILYKLSVFTDIILNLCGVVIAVFFTGALVLIISAFVVLCLGS